MRRWILLAVLAASEFSAYAAQRVTVQQLQQLLTQEQTAHISDEDAAQRLDALELTERLTESTLDQFETKFHPGKKTSAALNLLSDLSALLQPPSSELLHKDPPSAAEQQEIVQAAVNFTNATLKHMPDFLATRTTRSYENVPVITADSTFQSGLHSMGTFVSETGYRDGREVLSNTPAAAGAHISPMVFRAGLTSIGEFGRDLEIIMTDSAKNQIAWSHWEQTSTGLVAVFHYEVPKEASHYRIYFCCGWNSAANSSTSYDGTPAYHGSLSIDPSTGSILRVTLGVEFECFDPPPRYSLAVQYGKVDIDGRSSNLPIRSVAIGKGSTLARGRYWTNLYIDDVSFTNYHRFGSTVRILPSTPDR
jgi:hypothetical protein